MTDARWARARNRQEQRSMERQAREVERKGKRGGEWPSFERRDFPKGAVGQSGWIAEIDHGYGNGMFAVLVREVDTTWGPIQHAFIRNASDMPVAWMDKQRIKNLLFGADAIAVEVYPRNEELVNEANGSHLWVLPAGMELPFTIYEAPA